jgi:hypothetical protein
LLPRCSFVPGNDRSDCSPRACRSSAAWLSAGLINFPQTRLNPQIKARHFPSVPTCARGHQLGEHVDRHCRPSTCGPGCPGPRGAQPRPTARLAPRSRLVGDIASVPCSHLVFALPGSTCISPEISMPRRNTLGTGMLTMRMQGMHCLHRTRIDHSRSSA